MAITASSVSTTSQADYVSIAFPSGDVIRAPYVEAIVCETLDSITMYGHIKIVEISNLHTRIVGGETAVLRFETPFEDGEYNQCFIIYSKTPVEVLPNGQRSFSLLIMSQEAFLADNVTLNQRFNCSISDAVKSIYENNITLSIQPSGNPKLLEVDDSRLSFNHLVSNQRASIILQRLESLCADENNIPFVLFENSRGIMFKSLATLWQSRNDEPLFIYDTSQLVQNKAKTGIRRSFSLDRVQITGSFNLHNTSRNGGISSVTTSFDTITKTYTTNNYRILENENTVFGPNKVTHDRTVIEEIQNIPDMTTFIAGNSDQVPFYETYASQIGLQNSYENFLSDINVQFIQINTNYLNRAGDTIEMNFDRRLVPSDSRPQEEPNQLLNGRYIIKTVKHKFERAAIVGYSCAIEAVRIGYGEEV